MNVRGAVRHFGFNADKAACDVSAIENPVHGIAGKDIRYFFLRWKQDEGRLKQAGSDHRGRVGLRHDDGDAGRAVEAVWRQLS